MNLCFAIIGLFGLQGASGAWGVNPSFSDAPARKLLCIEKDVKIVAFANSPWPSYDAHAVKVRVSRSFVERMIRNGTPHVVSDELWTKMLQTGFTLPADVLAAHQGAIEAARAGDPMAFSIICEGALVVHPDRILFWSVLNDQNLYLTDGTFSCILSTDLPEEVSSKSIEQEAPVDLGNPPRPVESVAVWPAWMQCVAPDREFALVDAESLFAKGSVHASIDLERDLSDGFFADEVRLDEELKSFAGKMPEDAAAVLRARETIASQPELRLSRGVLFSSGKLHFWRSLDRDILEIRSGHRALLIVRDAR